MLVPSTMRVYVHVFIHTHLDLNVYPMNVEANDTVEKLKAKIHSRTGYSPCSQRLECAGKSMDNGWLVRHYNIEEGAQINVVIRFIGKGYVAPDLRLLAYTYNVYKSVCRKCDARLPPDATHCRKKKCHSNDIRLKNTSCLKRSERVTFWRYHSTNIRWLDRYK